MFQSLIAIMVSLSLIFGGTGVVTAAAQSSMPNDFLYPVKTISEDVRLALTTRTQTRLSLEQSFANRRVGEITTLAARGEAVPEKVTNRLQTALEECLNLTAGMEEPAMQQALIRMQTNTQQQLQHMAQVNQSTDPAVEQARLRLQEQLRLTELGLADPQGYQEQVHMRNHERQNQPTDVPPSTEETTPSGPQHTPSPDGGYGPGTQAGTRTGTPVQDGTGPGPGPGPMEPSVTPGPDNGNGNGECNGQCGMMTQTPDPGEGNGPGPKVTPQGTCTCTPAQDGTGPGHKQMDPTRMPGMEGGDGEGGSGGGGGGGKP